MSLTRWAGIALLFCFAGLAQARGDWTMLGERTVDRQGDHDEILVTGLEGDFHRIALRVQGAPVEFYRVAVHYSNGDIQEVDMREQIRDGGETRAIDLEGKDRVIERVVFNYRTEDVRRGPRAVVQLWGLS
jgi:hypothetical protein